MVPPLNAQLMVVFLLVCVWCNHLNCLQQPETKSWNQLCEVGQVTCFCRTSMSPLVKDQFVRTESPVNVQYTGYNRSLVCQVQGTKTLWEDVITYDNLQ